MRPIVTNCSGRLYRDDGLIVVNNATGPKADRIRKDITVMFKSEGLKITVETTICKAGFSTVGHLYNLVTKKYYKISCSSNFKNSKNYKNTSPILFCNFWNF